MKKLHLISFLLLFFGLYNTQNALAQFNIPEKPSFQTSVYDYANVLSPDEKSLLEQKLIKYADTTTTQIVVITIESLQGEDIGILTPRWAQTWGIGGTGKDDNGVLILMAKKERLLWMSSGYGLEDRLTAGIGGEIYRNIIRPEFKAGNYYNGFDKGTNAIFDVFKGKYKGERKQADKDKGFPILPIIIVIVFIILFIVRSKNNGGNSGNRGGGFNLLDMIVLSSLGRSGGGGFGGGGFGGGSSGGGGGFGGGFGGGGFSGGGSGGSW